MTTWAEVAVARLLYEKPRLVIWTDANESTLQALQELIALREGRARTARLLREKATEWRAIPNQRIRGLNRAAAFDEAADIVEREGKAADA